VPSPRAACRAKFADDASDGIRSDGRGAYVDGVDGVVCQVSMLEETGQNPAIRLNPQKSRTRSINFIFTPTFAVRDTSNLLAGVKLSMFVGETVTAGAHFYSALHSSQAANVEFNATAPPSTNVAVTRVGENEWKIEAPLVALARQRYGETRSWFAGALSSLAACKAKLNQSADAEALNKRSLAIYERAVGPDSPPSREHAQ
jgi:hypothetical protein